MTIALWPSGEDYQKIHVEALSFQLCNHRPENYRNHVLTQTLTWACITHVCAVHGGMQK